MLVDKIIDAFMFREGTEEDNFSKKPIVTTGSIVWGIILRSTVFGLISFYLLKNHNFYQHWYFLLFGLWFLVAFPAWKQYQKFNQRMDDFVDSTLCGSCKYFMPEGQLCTLLDEHVSKTYIPCEGENWEMKQ